MSSVTLAVAVRLAGFAASTRSPADAGRVRDAVGALLTACGEAAAAEGLRGMSADVLASEAMKLIGADEREASAVAARAYLQRCGGGGLAADMSDGEELPPLLHIVDTAAA